MDQLKTEFRVQAWLRRWAKEGLMATVVRRGDREAGALFLKVNRFAQGCEVFSRITGPSGSPVWLRATGPSPVAEAAADEYLTRQARYDADLWVLEVEDPKGTFVLDEPVSDL
jgi:GMP synthase (glutamine-hydrolysing)